MAGNLSHPPCGWSSTRVKIASKEVRMNIAVLKETCPGETRVALVPSLAPTLIKAGHHISIESRAGEGETFEALASGA